MRYRRQVSTSLSDESTDGICAHHNRTTKSIWFTRQSVGCIKEDIWELKMEIIGVDVEKLFKILIVTPAEFATLTLFVAS